MTDYAREVRNALSDPEKLVRGLGLDKGAERQATGLLICCPVHGERNPSCSVTRGPDGTIRVKCFSCDWKGDALHFVAAVLGLTEFRETLAEGARLAGAYSLESEIRDGEPRADRKPIAAPEPIPRAEYPTRSDVHGVWTRAQPAESDPEASAYLARRGLDPVLVTARQLARVIVDPLPPWARYRGRSWLETGHTLVVRAFDAMGTARSLRAIQVRTDEAPKRLPPAGKKASELVMLNRAAHDMLRGATPARVGIVEGEPDFLSWAMISDEPIIGLVSGSWHEGFAAAIPRACRVIIRTHEDEAGERYAAQVIETLKGKDVSIRRSSTEAA